MTRNCAIYCHCEIFVRKSKQSILAILESFTNHLLYVNLRLDLLIHLCNIARIYLLKSRPLDGYFTAFANPADCFVSAVARTCNDEQKKRICDSSRNDK